MGMDYGKDEYVEQNSVWDMDMRIALHWDRDRDLHWVWEGSGIG